MVLKKNVWLGQKVVIFTAGYPSQDRMLLIKRLRDNPNIKVVALVFDLYNQSFLKRLQFLRRKWGTVEFMRSMLWKFIVLIKKFFYIIVRQWHDVFFVPKIPLTYKEFCEKNSILFVHVNNINDEKNVKLLQELDSDLGVIIGGRILKNHIINIPNLGSLNIHKHNAEKYRGGGQTGFVEYLEGDKEIGVTIHFASEKVDAGDIIDMETFHIEEYDNDESIAIKADTLGIELYYKCICAVLQGTASSRSQIDNNAKTYYTTPFYKRDKLWMKKKKDLYNILNKKDKYSRRLIYFIYRNIRKIIFYISIPKLAAMRNKLEAKGKAPIIFMYYHGVSNLAENWMSLPLNEFKLQLDYAQKYYEIISMEKAVEILRSGKNYKTALVITFDDGYKSCHSHVLPLMRTYKIPATFFICAESSENEEILPHDFNNGYENAKLMNPDEIKEIAENGGEIGSHALAHENIADLDYGASDYVLMESKRILENICKRKIKYFSFPYGLKKDFTEESCQIAKSHYDAIFSAYGGYNFPTDKKQFHFQRIPNPIDIHSFKAILSGLHRLNPYYKDVY